MDDLERNDAVLVINELLIKSIIFTTLCFYALRSLRLVFTLY